MTTQTRSEITIKSLNDGEVLYAKGHLDKREFAEAVCRYEFEAHDLDDPPSDAYRARIEANARHECWHFVPSANWSEFRYMAFPAEPGSRGSFLVTVTRL